MNLLSKYRMELFGLAALGTVFTHYHYIVSGIPNPVSFILNYGGSGVYIFALLSGIGLYFSLSEKHIHSKSIISFYKRRAIRLLIPYCLIAGLWYVFKYFVFSFDPLAFLYELSTLSFWIEHKGAWYVAMLFPVYFLFPFYHKWIEKKPKTRIIKTIIGISINFAFGIILFFLNNALFDHLRSVWCSLFFFMIGNLIGKPLKENRFNDIPLLLSGIAVILIKILVVPLRYFMPVYTLSYAFSGVIIAILFSKLCSLRFFKFTLPVFSYLGTYSLEMYLANMVWIQVFQFFSISFSFDYYGLFSYALILLFGQITAIVFGMLAKRIDSIKKKKSNSR